MKTWTAIDCQHCVCPVFDVRSQEVRWVGDPVGLGSGLGMGDHSLSSPRFHEGAPFLFDATKHHATLPLNIANLNQYLVSQML